MDSPLSVSGFGLSHIGRIRQRNEDNICIDPQGRFALLADGMGGHRGGCEASRMAIELIQQQYALSYETLAALDEPSLREFFRASFQETSRKVYDRGQEDPDLENMGTTLVSWLMRGSTVHVCHVGDSRAYLIRNNQIFQTTMDHNFINEQISMGSQRSQIANFMARNAIFRNIGISPPSEPFLFSLESEEQDLWLLCSDGLSNKMSAEEILAIVRFCQAQFTSKAALPEMCKKLVEEAYRRGGEDNISVVMMRVE